jgi:hypothetical protein
MSQYQTLMWLKFSQFVLCNLTWLQKEFVVLNWEFWEIIKVYLTSQKYTFIIFLMVMPES